MTFTSKMKQARTTVFGLFLGLLLGLFLGLSVGLTVARGLSGLNRDSTSSTDDTQAQHTLESSDDHNHYTQEHPTAETCYADNLETEVFARLDARLSETIELRMRPLEQRLQQLDGQINQSITQLEKSISVSKATNLPQKKLSSVNLRAEEQDEAQVAKQQFLDEELLFELEEYDKNASAKFALAMDNANDGARGFSLDNLLIDSAECRGVTCRVQLRFSGHESSMKVLPMLLAASGLSNARINIEDTDQGSVITALMK